MNKKDYYDYEGWLNSDFFWKRALAIYLYGALVGAGMYAAAFVAGMIIGAL